MDVKLTFDLLPAIAILASVLAWYIPKFKDWFEALAPEKKQLFMLGLMAVIVIGTALLSAFGFLDVYHGTTWQEWVWYPLVDFVIAAITNAGVYKATNRLFGG
jgi:hypothetical protein